MTVVKVTHDDYVALDEFTGMFGEGDTPALAEADLKASLRDHADDLREHRDRDRLPDDWLAQLAYLEESGYVA